MVLVTKLHLSRPAMAFLGKCNMTYTFIIRVSLQSHKVNFSSIQTVIEYKLLQENWGRGGWREAQVKRMK